MKNLKGTERGITLVALVITIIILIILATVAINFAFGNNGLITQAEKARDMASNATIAEEEAMNSMMDEISNITGNEEASGAKTLVQAFNDGEIKAGDYVNYTPEPHDPVTVGASETGNIGQSGEGIDRTYSQSASTTWRVLGLSEDRQHLLLTSGSPIRKDEIEPMLLTNEVEIRQPYLTLKSYTAAVNGVTVLNKISNLYHNSTLADETRSMTIKDIENVLGGVTVTYPTEGNPDTGTVTLNADSSHTNIGRTTSYASYTYKSGDYTLTNPPQSATAGTKVNGDAYMLPYDYEGYQSLGIDIDRRTYDMLFADTTEDGNWAKSYWLASSGVYADSDLAYFGLGAVYDGIVSSGGNFFASDGDWRGGEFAVRPVVVLKSDITVEQIQVIPDQTEEIWPTHASIILGGNIEDDVN